MSKKMIGIEIGADTLKLAQVKNGKILSMAAERMPDHLVSEGRVTAPATMSKFLKEAMKATGIKGRECAFVLPPQMVVSQRLTMPVMSAAELKLNLPFEFKDYVGRNTDDYTFDYIVTDVHRYTTNFDDEILSMDWHESELENDDLKNYKAKAEFYVRQHQDHLVIAKLKKNVSLTPLDVQTLEKILWSEVGTREDYEAEYGQKPLGEFVREIVGLDMNAAKEAFSEYLNDTSLDANQI